MRRILCVFGTRPEAIKMAPVVRELLRRGDVFESRVCVTGQHRQMLDQVLATFGIQPTYDLDLMTHNQGLNALASRGLAALDGVYAECAPDWVVVQGDTTTAMVAALAAFHRGIRVAHVEAGLRTHVKRNPFPEEMNRRLVGMVGDLHFAPTKRARENLLGEGGESASILITGNTVIDALHYISGVLEREPVAMPTQDDAVATILVTVHRRESFGAPLESILRAVATLSDQLGSRVQFVWPVHPNPNVQSPIHAALGKRANVQLLTPMDYLPFVAWMKRCRLVLTDSGGIQEEAPAFGKPVLVLRETTERPEAIEAGTARLIGTESDRIVTEVLRLLNDADAYDQMAHACNPFGDGHAAERIADALAAF